MKKLIVTLLTLATVAAATNTYAVATVNANSYDADKVIYYLTQGTLASGTDIMVEILAGAAGGSLSSIKKGSLSEPGYFDFGVLTVPGLADNAQADFRIRAWKGGDSYPGNLAIPEAAESAKFTQATGAWNPNATPPTPPQGPSLALPAALTITVVPEPSILALALLGGVALILRRRS